MAEKMVAQMLGISGDGLSKMVADFQMAIVKTNERLIDIQEKQAEILNIIRPEQKALEHGGSDDNDRN